MNLKHYVGKEESKPFKAIQKFFNDVDPVLIYTVAGIDDEYDSYVNGVLEKINTEMSHSEIYAVVLAELKSGFDGVRFLEENSNRIACKIGLWMIDQAEEKK